MPGLKVFTGSIWRAVGVEDSYWDVLTATSASATVGLSWPVAGSSPSSYEIIVNNSITNVGLVNSHTVSGLTVGQTYSFKVRPVYSDGSTGGWSLSKNAGPTGLNAASGGTTLDVSNYNGTGQTWRVHTFENSGTFTVTSGSVPFSYLIVAGGGGGSNWNTSSGGGGAGGLLQGTLSSLSPTNYSISIGAGGGYLVNGSNTTAFGLTAIGGGRGGNPSATSGGSGGGGSTQGNGNVAGAAGTAGQGFAGGTSVQIDNGNMVTGGWGGGGGGAGGAGGSPAAGAGLSLNITGSSVVYAQGGSGAYFNSSVGVTGAGRGGGGGGRVGGGTAGVVIVAYRIA